ncbi:MAG TPA: DUF2142 domain-containing protein [Tepidisphaeraceae bacterium]|jgi:uncharacterized membrane protein|nr:DUF2142 domain-containing protein [Tepidisphaeraceae bacterium]
MAESRLVAWTHPHRIFAITAFLFGTALVLIVPPFQSPDESFHFLRAYQITEGGFVAHEKDQRNLIGATLPISLDRVAAPFLKMNFHPEVKASVNDIRQTLHIPLDPQKRAFQIFPNTAHYCPTCYVGQCLGIGLGRALAARPLVMFYLGREGNLLLWILLGFFALRSGPAIARPLLLLLLMPISINFAATLSADPSTNGLAAIFTALVCKYFALGPNSINRTKLALLAVISIPLTVSKLAYAPLLALLLLIPARNFGGRAEWAAKIALLLALNLAAFLMWSARSSTLDTRINPDSSASAARQLQVIEQHPARFAGVLLATIRRGAWYWTAMFVGIIGWFDAYLPGWFVIGYLTLLVLACWSCDDRPPLPSPVRAAIIILPMLVLVFLIIALLSYLFWTRVGDSLIYGINGRYLIPVAPATLMLLCSTFRRLPAKWRIQPPQAGSNAAVALISLGACIYFLAAVWSRYYG